MYDVNPVPYGDTLSLNVSLDDARIDIDLALEVVPFFGLEKDRARKAADQIVRTVQSMWRPAADRFGLSRSAQDAMAPSFLLLKS